MTTVVDTSSEFAQTSEQETNGVHAEAPEAETSPRRRRAPKADAAPGDGSIIDSNRLAKAQSSIQDVLLYRESLKKELESVDAFAKQLAESFGIGVAVLHTFETHPPVREAPARKPRQARKASTKPKGESKGKPGPKAKADSVNGRVLTYLTEHPDSSSKAIAEALGIKPAKASGAIQQLRDQGKVVAQGVRGSMTFSVTPE